MRNNLHRLVFPDLVHLEDVKFKSWSSNARTPLYRLDWSQKEFKTEETPRFSPGAVHGEDHFCGLPPHWDRYVKSLQFTIPHSYMQEIHRQTTAASAVWAGDYPFDTVIREVCLGPAIAHVWVAFRLIADCEYDPSTNYFSRSPRHFLTPHLLVYKFWFGQTGHGLLRRNARIGGEGKQGVEYWADLEDHPNREHRESQEEARILMDDLKEHETDYSAYHAKKYPGPICANDESNVTCEAPQDKGPTPYNEQASE